MPPKKEVIRLETLPLDSLQSIVNDTRTETTQIEHGLEALSLAQSKLLEASRSVSTLKAQEENTEMMIPLTSSLYVPGRVADAKEDRKVLVALGTGYYVKMSIDESIAYIRRRVKSIEKQKQQVHQHLKDKLKLLQATESIFQQKLQAARASGQIKA